MAGLGENRHGRHGTAGHGAVCPGEEWQYLAGLKSYDRKECTMKIQWKSGSSFKVDPQAAFDSVEQIRKRHNGNVSADAIVSAAKAKRHPLHPVFTWDDSEAGNEYRLEQARMMMRSFVVIRNDITSDRPQRAYEVVRTDQASSPRIRHVYKTVDDIMKDSDLRGELLGRALRELISLRNRYRDLQELAVVIRAIDETVESLTGV